MCCDLCQCLPEWLLLCQPGRGDVDLLISAAVARLCLSGGLLALQGVTISTGVCSASGAAFKVLLKQREPGVPLFDLQPCHLQLVTAPQLDRERIPYRSGCKTVKSKCSSQRKSGIFSFVIRLLLFKMLKTWGG